MLLGAYLSLAEALLSCTFFGCKSKGMNGCISSVGIKRHHTEHLPSTASKKHHEHSEAEKCHHNNALTLVRTVTHVSGVKRAPANIACLHSRGAAGPVETYKVKQQELKPRRHNAHPATTRRLLNETPSRCRRPLHVCRNTAASGEGGQEGWTRPPCRGGVTGREHNALVGSAVHAHVGKTFSGHRGAHGWTMVWHAEPPPRVDAQKLSRVSMTARGAT